MGENAHLYVFQLTINEKTIVYSIPDLDWASADIRIRDSRRTKPDATVWAEWLKLTYEYDLGDSWMHQITIETIEHLADEDLNEDALWVTPRCLAGERACPPEDAGGIGGYALLLDAWQNPQHPEHERLRQWVGPYYHPELFSVQQANSALAILSWTERICQHAWNRLPRNLKKVGATKHMRQGEMSSRRSFLRGHSPLF